MDHMPTDYAVIMLRKAASRGIDLLEGSDLVLAELEAAEFMAIQDYDPILERFSGLHTDPDWGFRLGQLFGMANHGPLGYGAMSASTISEGLAFLCRYMPTRTSYAESNFDNQNGALCIQFQLKDIAMNRLNVHCETFSYIFQSYIMSAGAPATSINWHFPYAAPAHRRSYKDWLQGSISFGANYFCLSVPAAIGCMNSAFNNEAGFSSAKAQCESILMNFASDSLASKAGNILRNSIVQRSNESVPMTEIPSEAQVAKSLGVSRRNLIFHLKQNGQSFKSIKDEIIKRQLKRLLQEDFRLDQIAERLGYSEPANLTRACKRLFHVSPAELREQLSNN